jgi:asparagine synthase (glutamine-hydrolysing)
LPQRSFSDRFLDRALTFADRPVTLDIDFHSAHARAIYLAARSKYHVHCLEWNNKIAASYGLDATFPFLDRDLVQFLMAVPGDVQARNGVPRALARDAMRGLLPESIRTRTWKADFSALVNSGVAQDAEALRHMLSSQSLAARLGYFDTTRVAAEVERLADGATGEHCVDSWDLTDLLGLEVWLQVFLRERSADATLATAAT